MKEINKNEVNETNDICHCLCFPCLYSCMFCEKIIQCIYLNVCCCGCLYSKEEMEIIVLQNKIMQEREDKNEIIVKK